MVYEIINVIFLTIICKTKINDNNKKTTTKNKKNALINFCN